MIPRSIVLRALPVLAIAALAGPAPAQGEKAPLVLNVEAAAESTPALRFRFLPESSELRRANGAMTFTRAMSATGRLEYEQDERISALGDLALEELPLDEAQALVDTAVGGAWELLEQAARSDHWDWGTSVRETGVGTLLPELGKLRQLARYLNLRARIELARGDFDSAAATMRVAFALATGLQEGETLIQGLVGLAIAELMLNRVEEFVRRPGAPNLYWALTELPSHGTLRNAYRTERCMLDYEFEGLGGIADGTIPPDQAVELIRQYDLKMRNMLDEFGVRRPGLGPAIVTPTVAIVEYPDAKAWMKAKGLTDREIEALPVTYVSFRYVLAEYMRIRDDMFKWTALPYWQGAQGLAAAEREMQAFGAARPSNVYAMLLPAVASSYLAETLHERHVAALRCVEAIRDHAAANQGRFPTDLSGMKRMPAPADPTRGAPFDYRVEGPTAIISSPVPSNGRPEHRMEIRITIRPPARGEK